MPSPRPLDLDQVAELLTETADRHCLTTTRDQRHRKAALYLAGLAPLLREWVEAEAEFWRLDGMATPPNGRYNRAYDRRLAASRVLLTHLTQSTPTAPGATDA